MSNSETSNNQMKEFRPDSAIKKYLTEISSHKLIAIINECCGTDYPLDAQVDFGKTEHFTLLGDLDKDSVRGDLAVTIDTEEHRETTNKIVIELQSTRDSDMGFRMLIYAMNMASKDNTSNMRIIPKTLTIYTTLDLPKRGTDCVEVLVDSFRVGEQHFSAANGDVLVIEHPYINLLAFEFDEFENSGLEPLKVVYPYRYRKDTRLIKKDEKFGMVMEKVKDYALAQDVDKIVVTALVRDIVIDLFEICKNNDELGEELEIMDMMNKTSSQILIEETHERALLIGIKQGQQRGILEGEKKGMLEGQKKGMLEGQKKGKLEGKLEGKLDAARGLLDLLSDEVIAERIGLPLDTVKQLRREM